MIGIYKITNKTNGKVYIGQSSNIEQRWKRHQQVPYNPNSEQYEYPLYRAIRKYSLNNFNFEIIEECSKEELNDKEIYWIQYYDSCNPKKGYNLSTGGSGNHFGKLNYDTLKQVIDLIKNSNIELKDIANKFNISLISIKDINQGHSYYNEKEKYPLRQTKNIKYYCPLCGTEVSSKGKRCVKCSALSQRIVERPNREELKYLIRTLPFTQIGKKYGVSDNAIRKWCVIENLPKTKKEINQYTEEEWEKI